MNNTVMMDERDQSNRWTFGRILRWVLIIALIVVLVYLLKDWLMKEQLPELGIGTPTQGSIPEAPIVGKSV